MRSDRFYNSWWTVRTALMGCLEQPTHYYSTKKYKGNKDDV